MKKIIMCFVLCAVVTSLFAACGSGGNTSSSEVDGGAAAVNPLVKSESLEALIKEIGVKIALPENAKDTAFYVLDKDIAQINFYVDDVKYTLRGTLKTEDVAGVYGDMKDVGTFTAISGDKSAEVTVTSTEESAVYKWSVDKSYYTLICGEAVKDVKTDSGLGKVALDCAISCM